MKDLSFTKAERDALIQAFYEAKKKTSWPDADSFSTEERKAAYAEQEALLAEYAERLPFIPLSRCPFTEELLEYPMDPFGFDGIWWRKRETTGYPVPRGGKHFRMVLGAVDFHGRVPSEAAISGEVLPGPGVPFVLPMLFQVNGMQLVISSMTLPHGDTAYLTTYYSEKPLHGAFLNQPWGRDTYPIYNLAGDYEGWGYSTWEWGFDIQPWIDEGRVQWIAPGDDSFTLLDSGPCPYVGLEGARYPQIIKGGQIIKGDLPTGAQPDPMD